MFNTEFNIGFMGFRVSDRAVVQESELFPKVCVPWPSASMCHVSCARPPSCVQSWFGGFGAVMGISVERVNAEGTASSGTLLMWEFPKIGGHLIWGSLQ